MRPVLLLHVRIVVFLVGASAGELDPFPLAPSLQMPVDEFRTIVRIHSEKTERQGPLHLLQGPFYCPLAAPQPRSGLLPAVLEPPPYHPERAPAVAGGGRAHPKQR